MKVIGLVPARMASSRFPGKPMHKILGRPMVEHVFLRAAMFKGWDHLALTTCDDVIADFGRKQGWPVIMTSDKHTRCLDRIAEAAPKIEPGIKDDDVVVCVQGDEPMLYPDMIDTVVKPLRDDPSVKCTVLAMDIVDEESYRHKDVVKIIHDLKGDVLYTSRAPVPWCEKFTPALGAKRIYGIFAFRWKRLQEFSALPESPLELKESCDSNRMFDHGLKQRVAPYRYIPSYAVDNPEDAVKCEKALRDDPYAKLYL